MGYPSDSERPAKRLKPSSPFQRLPAVAPFADYVVPPSYFPAHSVPPTEAALIPWSSVPTPVTPPGYTTTQQPWSPSWPLPEPSQVLYSSQPAVEPLQEWTWAPSTLPPVSPSTAAEPSIAPNRGPPLKRARTSSSPGLKSSVASSPAESKKPNLLSTPASPALSNVASKQKFVTPFQDCIGTFGTYPTLQFHRPEVGHINGYVKIKWTDSTANNKKTPPPRKATRPNLAEKPDAELLGHAAVAGSTSSNSQVVKAIARGDVSTSFNSFTESIVTAVSHAVRATSSSAVSAPSPNQDEEDESSVDQATSLAVSQASTNSPKRVPPHFGHFSRMTLMDRRFWEFYVRNWCPGRSVLQGTNLWLVDFAQMQNSAGIRCAIQCLAGVYINDFVTGARERVQERMNELFKVAENRLEALMNHPDGLNEDRGTEAITISTLLSMQDIVLTERRLVKPHKPRWLRGFLYGEHALSATDPGSRFWDPRNVQLTSLRVSQSVIVGRAVILAQPMAPLPSSDEFDSQIEGARFGWLLYGSLAEMYEIHGGCGFSKKLLYIFSQVAFCTAALQQDPKSVYDMTLIYLEEELKNMRQWVRPHTSWEAAKEGRPPIDWVRKAEPDYIINNDYVMADVTAEAWRIAGLIYLQCRGLRLPRTHPAVMENMADLAHCIRIMPTSGTQFTAQAPLFPVFLLGLVAVDVAHKKQCYKWFDQVVSTPVRSSVPPLFMALQRISGWIDEEFPPVSPQAAADLDPKLGLRDAWWERLVQQVDKTEPEVLCLT